MLKLKFLVLFFLFSSNIYCEENGLKNLREELFQRSKNTHFFSDAAPNSLHFLQNGLEEKKLRNFDQSREFFQKVIDLNAVSDHVFAAQAAICQIDMKKTPTNSQNLIDALKQDSYPHHLLAALEGELLFNHQEYEKAAQILEQALPQKNLQNAPWYTPTLFLFTLSKARSGNTEEAAAILLQYFLHTPDASCRLALAEVLTQTPKYSIKQFIGRLDMYPNERELQHALFLLALNGKNYEEKLEALYPLIRTLDKTSLFYIKGWYELGRVEFEHTISGSRNRGGFKKAKQAFSKAVEYSKNNDPLLYQKGVVALAKIETLEKEKLSKQTLEALEKVDLFEGKVFLAETRLNQGELFKARNILSTLYQNIREEHLPTLLYVHAQMEFEPNLQKHIRLTLHRLDSQASFSAENYLNIYSEKEYLNGGAAVHAHLEHFVNMYPQSPYTLVAYALLGGRVSQQAPDKALDYFKKGVHQTPITPPFFETYDWIIRQFAYLSIETGKDMHQALSFLEYLKHQKGEDIFLRGELLIASGHIMEGKIALHRYLKQSKSLSPWQEKAYYRLGMVALQDNLGEEAYHWFNEGSKIESLNPHLMLALLMGKGRALQITQQLSQAMLIYSNIVNTHIASPLRVEAMYRRALIYEEQKRALLAKKQLESLSTMGGKWSILAKEKLAQEYCYE